MAHVEINFESTTDAVKRTNCDRKALDFAKMLLREEKLKELMKLFSNSSLDKVLLYRYFDHVK